MVNIVFIVIGIAIGSLGFLGEGVSLLYIIAGIGIIGVGVKGIKYRTKKGDLIDTSVIIRNEKLDIINVMVDSSELSNVPITLQVDNTAVKAYYKNDYLGSVDIEFCPDLPKLVKKGKVESVTLNVDSHEQKNQWEVAFPIYVKTT